MPQSDYYIAFDYSGEPYIAHAWGQRGPNQSHKYIARIGEGPKARYFYTPEELRAFQMGGRQKAQNAVNAAKQKTANVANKVKEKASDTAGRIRENSTLLNVGNQYRAAQRAHQNSKSSDPETAKWGKKGYDDNNTLGGKAYKAQQRVKDFVEEQKSKDTAENLFKKKYGVEPKKVHETIIETPGDKFVKETKEKLKSTSDRMKEEFRKNKDKLAEKTGISQRNEFKEAQSNAMKTGKGEDWDKANYARDKYENTKLGKAESEAYKTKSAIENKAWEAKNKVTDRVNKAKETYKKVSDKAKDLDGADERKRFDLTWEKVMKAEPGSEAQVKALDAFEKARSAYLKTPMGIADYGSERAKEILSGADGTPKEIAEELVDKTKKKLKSSINKK